MYLILVSPQLRLYAQAANNKRIALGKSTGGSRKISDLGDKTKWALSDAVQFGQTLQQFEEDIEQLKEGRKSQLKFQREVQSNLLKGGLLFECLMMMIF